MGFASDFDGGVGRADGDVDDVDETVDDVDDTGGELAAVDVTGALTSCQNACLGRELQYTHSAWSTIMANNNGILEEGC